MNDYIKREMAADCIVLECDDVTLEQARQAIKDCPSADVVEVVRCKDCKYYDVNWDSCTRWTSDQFNQASVRNNDYCSFGERKDNE